MNRTGRDDVPRWPAAAAALVVAGVTTFVAAASGLPVPPGAPAPVPSEAPAQARQAWVTATARAVATGLALERRLRDPEEARRRLQSLREQITELERRLGELGERRVGLVEEFEAADVRLALSRRRLEIVRLRLDVVTRDLEERRDEVERLDRALEQARRDLSARIVALYRMGPLSYSRVLLAADTADEVLTGYQMVTRLAAQERSMIATVRIRLAEYREAVADLEETQQQLDEVRREEGRAVTDLRQRQAERQELIRQIDIEAAESRRALEAREEDAEAMARLVAELTAASGPGSEEPAAADAAGVDETAGEGDEAASGDETAVEGDETASGDEAAVEGDETASGDEAAAAGEEAAVAAGTPADPPTTFAAAAGRLPWPGHGEVTLSFGRQRHPVYDTYTLSKGIEIAAPAGSPVRAVFAGDVVFADWFQSYGLVVILNHGADWFTIYGHVDRVEVHVGDRVEAGGRVATVGDSGSLTGPSLYFEIRHGTEALNPDNWLRRR